MLKAILKNFDISFESKDRKRDLVDFAEGFNNVLIQLNWRCNYRWYPVLAHGGCARSTSGSQNWAVLQKTTR